MKLLALALVACGGSEPAVEHPKVDATPADRLAQRIEQHDLAGVVGMFATPLSYGGLWFSDPACTQQFPTQGRIDKDRLPAFAACVAALPLKPSKRRHIQSNIWVLDYAPGFEIEIQVAGSAHGYQVRWIGYAGRRDTADALPTVSGETLTALRTDHVPPPALPPSLAANAASLGLKYEYTWFKICLDASGAITGVHARETTSPDAERTFSDLAKQWTFAPFAPGGSPIPACGLVRATSTPTDDFELLPFDVPIGPGEHAPIATEAVKRVEGDKLIMPDEDDRKLFQRLAAVSAIGAFKVCFDESGAIDNVVVLGSTGLPNYDRRIVSTIKSTWRYRTVKLNGAPIKACTGATFTTRNTSPSAR